MHLSNRSAIWLVCLLGITVLLSTCVVAVQQHRAVRAAQLHNLQSDLARQSELFQATIAGLLRDTRILASMPVTQRAAADLAGPQQLAANSVETLTEAFTLLAEHSPDYLQIRLLAATADAPELVRVERRARGERPAVVPASRLQRKGETAYIQAASSLPANQAYLSPINLNREQGQIQQPEQPVIRAVMPVLHDGQRVAYAVINHDITRALSAVNNPHGTGVTAIANALGQAIVHPDPARAFGFESGDEHLLEDDFPLLRALAIPGDTTSGLLQWQGQSMAAAARRVAYGPDRQQNHLSAVFLEPAVPVWPVVFGWLPLILAIIAVAAMMLVWLLNRIQRESREANAALTHAVRMVRIDAMELDVPEGLPKEANDLARAMQIAVRELRDRSDQLAATNRDLQQFAYIASHDLQEPVRTITSYVGLLEKKYAEGFDARGQASLRFISESCERMRSLIHGLLEYSRLGSQRTPQMTDLGTLLQHVQQDMHTTIAQTSARIRVDPLPALRVFPTELRLLFQNLISNAIKFVPEDREPAVHISASRRGAVWRLTVTDNGIGIAPEHRARVFQIFQRLHERGSSYTGTGIGLAHCRKIAELHGGRIWVENRPDGESGCRFCVEIQEVAEHEETETSLAG